MSSRRQPEFITYSLILIDLLIINSIALGLNSVLSYISISQQLVLISAVNISWLLAALLSEAYHIKNLLHMSAIMRTTVKTSFIHMQGITFTYCFIWAGAFPRVIFTIYIVLTFIALSLTRFAFSRFLRRVSANGYNFKNALIVGMGVEAKRIKKFLSSGQFFGINFMGYITKGGEDFKNSGTSFFDTISPEEKKTLESQRTIEHLELPVPSSNLAMAEASQGLSFFSHSNTVNLYNSAHRSSSYMRINHLPDYNSNILGEVKDLPDLIRGGKVNDIYWTLPTTEDYHVKEIIDLCEKYMVRFHRVPHFLSLPFRNFDVDNYGGLPVLQYRKEPLENLFNRFLKRTFDILFSSLVILFVLSWLIPLVWLFMKYTMPGPVFFAQERSGKNNETFKVLKFRSMRVNNDSDELQATKGDTRITKFGAFLRKSSLDEMPQFINVFLGHMTVVGPRPHMLKHTEEYSEKINDFMVRHLIKPGITGWAQVNGYRGGTEALFQMQGRVEHDVWYLENWTFWLDLRIIVKTVTNAISGEENAY